MSGGLLHKATEMRCGQPGLGSLRDKLLKENCHHHWRGFLVQYKTPYVVRNSYGVLILYILYSIVIPPLRLEVPSFISEDEFEYITIGFKFR